MAHVAAGRLMFGSNPVETERERPWSGARRLPSELDDRLERSGETPEYEVPFVARPAHHERFDACSVPFARASHDSIPGAPRWDPGFSAVSSSWGRVVHGLADPSPTKVFGGGSTERISRIRELYAVEERAPAGTEGPARRRTSSVGSAAEEFVQFAPSRRSRRVHRASRTTEACSSRHPA